MMILEKVIEQPWAFATREKIEPWMATGNVYRYFHTKAEAEKAIAWHERKGRYHGPIEYRPGESHLIGYV
jgi:hypothetical protein